MTAIKELYEDRRLLTGPLRDVRAVPFVELVTELHPVFVYELAEAAYSPIVRMHEYLREDTHLWRAVPPIAAVHKNVLLLHCDIADDGVCSLEDKGDQLIIASFIHTMRVGDHVVEYHRRESQLPHGCMCL